MAALKIPALAFILCMLGILAGANVPRIGFDDMPLSAGLSNDMIGRASSGGSGPWNGKDYVVVWTVDDGADDAAIGWATIAESYGFRLSIYPCASDTSAGLDHSELQALYAAGHEIGNTGTEHHEQGLLRFVSTDFNAIPDSLRDEVSGRWVQDIVGELPSTYVVDMGPMNYEVAEVMRDSAYSTMRGQVYSNSAKGFNPGYQGADRWDYSRPLDPTKASSRYSWLAWPGEDSELANNPIFGTVATDQSEAAVQAACDSALAWSARNGYCPVAIIIHNSTVTDTEFGYAAAYLAGRGDVWQATMSQMWSEYLSTPGIGFVDPPDWAVFANVEGYTADDSLFVGPVPDELPAATDSCVFHAGSTATTFTGFDVYSSGTRGGYLSPASPTSTAGTTIRWDFNKLPLDGSEDNAIQIFDIDELAGKTIVRAVVGWKPLLAGADVSSAGDNYIAVVGVTNDTLLAHVESSSICYSYSSGTTPWGIDWDDFKWVTDFGEYVYPRLSVAASTLYETDVTSYIAWRDGEPAMLMWNGRRSDSSNSIGLGSHTNGTASNRPYLKVWYAE